MMEDCKKCLGQGTIFNGEDMVSCPRCKGSGKTESFEDGLILAVNLGHDADTVGSVYGSLAGAFYGFGNIPDRWLVDLKGKDILENVYTHTHACTHTHMHRVMCRVVCNTGRHRHRHCTVCVGTSDEHTVHKCRCAVLCCCECVF